jgi:hypothetical protein
MEHKIRGRPATAACISHCMHHNSSSCWGRWVDGLSTPYPPVYAPMPREAPLGSRHDTDTNCEQASITSLSMDFVSAQALGSALGQAQLLKQQLDRTHLLSSESVRDRVGKYVGKFINLNRQAGIH